MNMDYSPDGAIGRCIRMRSNVVVQGQDEAQLRTVQLERPVGGESQSPQHGEKG